MTDIFKEQRLYYVANNFISQLKDLGMCPDEAVRFLVTLAAGLCSGCVEHAEINKQRFAEHFSEMLDEHIKLDKENGQAEI